MGYEQELLFLIYQYLNNCTTCTSSSLILKQELVRFSSSSFSAHFSSPTQESQGLLGEIHKWDGNKRIASVKDMQKKYHSTPTNEIIRILKSSVSSRNVQSFLNQPQKFDVDRNVFEEIKSIISRIVDITLRVRANLTLISRNNARLRLDHEPQRDLFSSEPLLQNLKSSSLVMTEEDVVQTLRSIGRIKNTKLLEKQIHDLNSENASLHSESVSLRNYITTKHPDYLVHGLGRGTIDNGISWLMSRRLGHPRYAPVTTSTFNLPRSYHSEDIADISLSPHSTIESLLVDQYNLLWSSSGHLIHPAYSSVFDRTGSYIITGADDYLVKIWNVESGQLVKTCRGHPGFITVITVSPDNSLFATGCTTGSVRLWRLSDGKCLGLMEHQSSVNWLQFDFSTGSLLSAGDDGQCIIWDLTCYIPFNETNCYTDVRDYQEGGRRWWVGDISIDSCPLLKSSLVASSSTRSESLACGVFSWNKHQHMNDKLGCLSLPHLKDGLSGEPIKITTFDICPTENIVATGCEDGIARIWKFNESTPLEGQDLEQRNVRMAEDLRKLQKMKDILTQSDYSKLETTTMYLLCRLEGHMDEVTDIKFSQLGDRLCTGSLKDGTVRIWSFSKNFLKNEVIILNMNDHEHDSSTELSRLSGEGISFRSSRLNRNQRNTNTKALIYNLAWSCDDQRIIVVHSSPNKKMARIQTIPTSLRVFNSHNGKLLHSFGVSEQKSHVLAVHPVNPSIAFTGGDDGYMNIWNIERGALISQFRLLSPPHIEEIMKPDLPVEILDASFSSDGLRIAVTDAIGRVIVLGRDNPEKYVDHSYPEQYFSTDYAVVVHDHDGWPIDEGTQLPLHQAPVGPLVNMNHIQYQNQPPITSYELPSPLSLHLIQEIRVGFLAQQQNFQRNLLKAYLAMKKQKQYLNESSDRDHFSKTNIWGNGNRNEENLTRRLKQTDRFQPSTERRRAIVLSDEDSIQGDNDAANLQLDDSQDSDYDQAGRRTRRSISNRPQRQSSRRESNPENRRILRPNQLPQTTRTRAQRAISRQYEENEFDGGDSSNSSASVSGETDEEEENVLDDDEIEIPIVNDISSKKNHKDSSSTLPRVFSGWTTLRSKGKYHRMIPLDTIIERDWLCIDSPTDHHYCPQVGDQVMYFPQGHMHYLNLIPEQKRPPWMSFPQRWPVVECRILDLSFEFPTQTEYKKCQSVAVKITLQLTGRPLRWGNSNCGPGHIYSSFVPLRESRHTSPSEIIFEVVSRNSHLPDFVIPAYLYYRSTLVNWKPSIEFRSFFQEYDDDQTLIYRDYLGTVQKVTDSDPRDWAHSPWESLEICWKDSIHETEFERISPWDAIVPDIEYPSKKYFPLSLPTELRLKFLGFVETLLDLEDYQPFAYPVDSEIFPDYHCIIPVSMYLDLIKRRLENDFYHQNSALEKDISLILINCETYNVTGAPIISLAATLVDKMLSELRELMSMIKEVQPEPDYSLDTSLNEPEVPQVYPTSPIEPIHRTRRTTRTSRESNSQSDLRLRFNANNRRSSARLQAAIASTEVPQSATFDSPEPEIPDNEERMIAHSSGRSTRKRKRPLHLDEVNHQTPLNEDVSDDAESEVEALSANRRVASRVTRSSRRESRSQEEEESEEELPQRTSRTRMGASKRLSSRTRTKPDESSSESQSSSDSDSEPSDDVGTRVTRNRRYEHSKVSKTDRGERQTRSITLQNADTKPISSRKSTRSSESIKAKLLSILNSAEEIDKRKFFHEPVDLYIFPEYQLVISHPMDFSTLRTNIDSGKYRTLSQFVEELMLIYDNCETFNEEGSQIFKESKRQRREIKKIIEALEEQ